MHGLCTIQKLNMRQSKKEGVFHFTTYAHLASALINNELYNTTADDRELIKQIYAHLPAGADIVNCDSEGHFGHPEFGELPGDIVEFTALVR